MIHIQQAIVVEGKYDKIKLSSIVDAVILVTNGFQIYKNPEQLDLIRYYARTTGVILLTDADRAGFQIRNYLKGAIREGRIYQVYTPDIYGKEHRKEKPSAEGKLGVEGIQKELLLAAFERAGILTEEADPKSEAEQITQYDLYAVGLSGGADSSTRRRALQRQLSLPERLSTASLLDVLNTMYTKEAFLQMMQQDVE
jgi:ribonuclease M5